MKVDTEKLLSIVKESFNRKGYRHITQEDCDNLKGFAIGIKAQAFTQFVVTLVNKENTDEVVEFKANSNLLPHLVSNVSLFAKLLTKYTVVFSQVYNLNDEKETPVFIPIYFNVDENNKFSYGALLYNDAYLNSIYSIPSDRAYSLVHSYINEKYPTIFATSLKVAIQTFNRRIDEVM